MLGIRDEIQERLELSFVLIFIECIIESSPFGVGFIFFSKLDEQVSRIDFTDKIPVVDLGVVYLFIKILQLRNGKLFRQQLKQDRVQGCFITNSFFCFFDHDVMIKDEGRCFINQKPFRMVTVADLCFVFIDVYQSEISNRYRTFYRISFRASISF
ncbi:hypothetical protein D3C71_1467430 [compost metagenome]